MLLDAEGQLKLCDFGLSALMEDGPVFGCRGSFGYAAPEVLRSHCRGGQQHRLGYDGQKADIWSCGVVLFVMLYGYPPWDVARETNIDFGLFRATDGTPNVRPWNRMAAPFRTVFHRLLNLRPNRRWTASLLTGYLSRDLGWSANPGGRELTHQHRRLSDSAMLSRSAPSHY